MKKINIRWALLAIALMLGCAGRTTEKTTYDESVEQRPPEPPKAEADDLEREYHEK
jgi:hypothetical protein